MTLPIVPLPSVHDPLQVVTEMLQELSCVATSNALFVLPLAGRD